MISTIPASAYFGCMGQLPPAIAGFPMLSGARIQRGGVISYNQPSVSEGIAQHHDLADIRAATSDEGRGWNVVMPKGISPKERRDALQWAGVEIANSRAFSRYTFIYDFKIFMDERKYPVRIFLGPADQSGSELAGGHQWAQIQEIHTALDGLGLGTLEFIESGTLEGDVLGRMASSLRFPFFIGARELAQSGPRGIRIMASEILREALKIQDMQNLLMRTQFEYKPGTGKIEPPPIVEVPDSSLRRAVVRFELVMDGMPEDGDGSVGLKDLVRHMQLSAALMHRNLSMRVWAGDVLLGSFNPRRFLPGTSYTPEI